MVALVNVVAVASEESMLDKLLLWVKVVYHCVCVGLMTRCEDHQLEVLRQILKDFPGVWPDIDGTEHGMPSRKSDRNFNLMFFLKFLKAVNESLIEIQDNCNFP